MTRACLILIATRGTASAAWAGDGLEFEVASVRGPTPPPAFETMQGGPGTSDPERISYSRVRMGVILRTAFGLKLNELVGPDWMNESNVMTAQAFDIQAKVPVGTAKEQANEMMRSLIRARFHLAFHFEKRILDGYDLVIAKGDSKLKPAATPPGPALLSPDAAMIPGEQAATDTDGFPVLPPGRPALKGIGTGDGHLRVTARMMPVSSLVDLLQGRLMVFHIVDKTGLTSAYDFKLDLAAGFQSGALESRNNSAPEIFSALERQLGLRREKTRVPVDVLVVDHIDKTPTPN
jgi:uncharacterized protein (TIGR03435 family)